MNESFVFLADGFEEIEALSVIDIMRRAEIPVKTISITDSLQVKGAHGVIVTADLLFNNTMFTGAQWLILPGGMPGAQNLVEFAPLCTLLKEHNANGGLIGAICAAPAVVLGRLGLLEGHSATCYPGFEADLNGARHIDEPVVASGNIITGQGPGFAMDFGFAIVKKTLGELAAEKVAAGMLIYHRSTDHIDHYFG